MSFFGIGRPQPTTEQKIAAVESEMRMMAETYNRYASFAPSSPDELYQSGSTADELTMMCRLQKNCQAKCIPTNYLEGELNKGESVCLDRCTAKYLDTSMKVSEIMQQQGQAMGGQQQGGGGMF